MLKRFFSVCLLLSVLSSLSFSEEKYFATETQIQELEEIFQMQKAKLEEQKNLIGMQKKSIQNLQKHLSEAQESLKKSETKNFQNKLITGIISFLCGAGTSFLIIHLKCNIK